MFAGDENARKAAWIVHVSKIRLIEYWPIGVGQSPINLTQNWREFQFCGKNFSFVTWRASYQFIWQVCTVTQWKIKIVTNPGYDRWFIYKQPQEDLDLWVFSFRRVIWKSVYSNLLSFVWGRHVGALPRALTLEMMFLPLEHKIYNLSSTCNILYLYFVSLKFIELCMETPCWCPSEGVHSLDIVFATRS